MWQRLTEPARRAVYFAQEEAGQLGENYVSTEHLLLGLIRETDFVAVRLLDQLGVSVERIRSEIERQVARGDGRLGQDMQLTPRAMRVIDLAYDEARQLNNNYIGTEHLLLGLIREGEGLAGRVLSKLGVTLEKARTALLTLQDGGRDLQDLPKVGDRGILRSAAARERVEVAVDEDAYRELVAVFKARDHHDYRELVTSGRVLLLPVGTEVKRLLQRSHITLALGYRVRILSGDHAGTAGWVARDEFEKTGEDDAPFPPTPSSDERAA